MTIPFTGGCMCRALRYECTAEPVFTFNCHCRDCQRASGSPFGSILTVPKDAVKITGMAHSYDLKADSGNTISRAFCPTCGALVFAKTTGDLQTLALYAGSLDDPSWFRPGVDIYTASAQPWDYMNPELPKFPKIPPQLAPV
jgi:hypothetical protein